MTARLWSFALALLVLVSVANAADLQGEEVLAVEYAWASAVAGREPVDRLTSPVSTVPLTLWTRISGNAAALRRLDDGGLPLRHVWMRVAADGFVADAAPSIVDEISLNIGNVEQLRERLGREAAARGRFDWRTWSTKEHLAPGRWVVRLLYADRTPVPCRSGERVIRDCMIAVTVGDGARRER